MNDFTKEELQEILKYISLPIWTDSNKLINKIQSMIDNYCEHDWRKGVHLFNDIYCTKCSKRFEVNNEAD